MAKTAEQLSLEQKEISVSEFFEKNKHLLGFDNPTKALLMAVKEAVDNSLDACEEADVLPEITVKLKETGEDRFRITVQDNGPGIVKEQVPRIFGKLLYGSKFHRLRQSLTYDEPIMAYVDGKIKILPIGEFVDSFLTLGEETKDITHLKITVPSFDWQNHSYMFRPVSHVIRHRKENEVIKLKLETNREIKVTGCHSLFSAENGELKEVEARKLNVGDFIAVPKSINPPEEVGEINILDYISLEDVEKNWLYVYDIPSYVFERILESAQIVHKKTDKSRKYYRIGNVDILDDSWKQYTKAGFLPIRLVIKLGLKGDVKDCALKSYFHGKETRIPITIPLDGYFLRFLGLFAAEGHTDKRQIGLTFGKHEDGLIEESINFARKIGVNFTVETRERSIRIKIFGGILSTLFEKWCGKGAHNKHIPEFVYRVDSNKRQHFIDGLYEGDGHKVRKRNCIMLSTVSKVMANELMYLWLMQGVTACLTTRRGQGLGAKPYIAYVVSVYGADINKSFVFKTNRPTKTRSLNYNSTQLLTQKESDILLLRIKDIELIEEGNEFVYDLSVPECENFVGGFGGVSCHNSRGQQGIGISAVLLYSQLTTGSPFRVWSKTESSKKVSYYELFIDTIKNEPKISKEEQLEDGLGDHGVKVEMDTLGRYRKTQSVDDYLRQTSISNPFAKIAYSAPDGTKIIFPRTAGMPKPPKEMRAHPYGVEFGVLLRMLASGKSRTLQSFLTNEFSSVGAQTAKEVCKVAKLDGNKKPNELIREEIERLLNAMQKVKIQRPPLDCLSPIGKEELEKRLKSEHPNAEFIVSLTREPEVYRGNPFQIEIALVYGGDLKPDQSIEVVRIANRVPLLYQAGACATTEAVKDVEWRRYGLQQPPNSLPTGPMILIIHMASTWVPFISESKEAIASYPEIVKEMKLAIQDAAREMGRYLSGKRRAGEQKRRMQIFERYATEIAVSVAKLVSGNAKEIETKLKAMLSDRVKLKEFARTEKDGAEGKEIKKDSREDEEE